MQRASEENRPPPPLVDPSDVTVLGQVERKGETSNDQGETPSKKSKKTSQKSPSKKKAGKPTDFQSELKIMDDKWSEHFARLEAMFLAKSFTVPIEPVQNSHVVVTDRPFIPPVQWTTGVTGEKQPTGQREMKKPPSLLRLPVQSLPPSLLRLPVRIQRLYTPARMLHAVDRLKVQPPGPAIKIVSSGRTEVQPPDPTGHPTATKKRSSTFTGPTVSVEEPEAEEGNVSDRASSIADKGEVSDLESTGPEQEELLDVDQELSAEQSYRETLREVIHGLE